MKINPDRLKSFAFSFVMDFSFRLPFFFALETIDWVTFDGKSFLVRGLLLDLVIFDLTNC